MKFKPTMVSGLFVILLAGIVLANEWRTSEYFLPFFVVGKASDNLKYSMTVVASDNGGFRWNRGYSVFFRDNTGNPVAFPGVTFTGEPFSADSRYLYVYDRGTAKIEVPDSTPLTIGWMSISLSEVRADETEKFQPSLRLYGRIDARNGQSLLYSFMTDFRKSDASWTVELTEKGTWISILNPGSSAIVANLNLWDDKETSNFQQRGGPRPFTKDLVVNARSTVSEFVEIWFPQITHGKLEIKASIPVVVSAVQRVENLITTVPVSPGIAVKQ